MTNVSGYSVGAVQNYFWFVWLSDDTLWLKVRKL